MDDRIALNKRRARAIGVSFWGLVFAVIFILIGVISQSAIAGLLAGIIAASVWTALAWFRSASIVLDLCDAEDADPNEHARLFNVVSGLRAAMGVPPVDLLVVEDPSLNALAVGRDPNNASILVTSGLLNDTSLIELEGAIALALQRIKSHSISPETFVIGTFGFPAVLAEAADGQQWLARILKAPMPWIDKVINTVHGGRDEYETDIEATLFTRYPPALASVLTRMSGQSAPAVATPVTAHLWIAPPLAPSAHPNATRLHAPLKERVAVLEEL